MAINSGIDFSEGRNTFLTGITILNSFNRYNYCASPPTCLLTNSTPLPLQTSTAAICQIGGSYNQEKTITNIHFMPTDHIYHGPLLTRSRHSRLVQFLWSWCFPLETTYIYTYVHWPLVIRKFHWPLHVCFMVRYIIIRGYQLAIYLLRLRRRLKV